MHLHITPIPIYTDNYVWVISLGDKAWIIDPGLHEPVIDHLNQNNLSPQAIWVTHNHWDHVTGIAPLVEHYHLPVYGPANSPTPCLSHPLSEGDQLSIGQTTFEVMEIPGHTSEHIAFFASQPKANEAPILFCGDTLFSSGCGRQMTGTMEQLYRSTQRIAQLPPSTKIYCTHEYTLANVAFAQAVEPENDDLSTKKQQAVAKRNAGKPTLPTRVDIELKTNPFLRCHKPEVIKSLETQSRTIINRETTSIESNSDGQRSLREMSVDQHSVISPTNPTKLSGSALECFSALRQWKDQF